MRQRLIRTAFGPLLVGAALALSACAQAAPALVATPADGASGEPSAAAPAASVTPADSLTTACQLLTLKEAEAVVGTTLTAGVEGDPDDPSCSYEPDPGASRTAQVRVLAGPGAKYTLDVDRGLDHEFTKVDGIGDEAYQEDYAIFFRTGSRWNAVTVVSLDDTSGTKQQLQDAAKVVVSRLP